MKLTQQQKDNISLAIKAVEAKTNGELVTVIAKKSDHYAFIALFWAAIFAICLPAFGQFFLADCQLLTLLQIELALFLLLYIIIDYTSLKFMLLPKHIAHQRASRRAHEQFVKCGVHLTRQHTGILLYVSTAEHFVEIIADRGISSAIDQNKWQDIIDEFVHNIQQKQVEQGFIEAINALGEILANTSPADADNLNELTDELLEID